MGLLGMRGEGDWLRRGTVGEAIDWEVEGVEGTLRYFLVLNCSSLRENRGTDWGAAA